MNEKRRHNKPRYALVLTALPSDIPPVIRLRRLLKALRRTYGFRCEHIRPLEPAAAPPRRLRA
jgi:hypothetical protein